MSIIPIVNARKLLLILLRAGFRIIRQKGSHIRLTHPITKRSTTIPMHVGDLSRGLLMEIIKQAGLPLRVFLRLLGKK
jgi:predicted RNA binding protein YcfA (HicA-like mRNA interferase family)